jgi:hypothetical protein
MRHDWDATFAHRDARPGTLSVSPTNVPSSMHMTAPAPALRPLAFETAAMWWTYGGIVTSMIYLLHETSTP